MDDIAARGQGRPWPSYLFELDPPEQLLLNGIRYWIAGWVRSSPEPWEQAWADFSRQLGQTRSREAVAALAGLVDTLRGNVRRAFHYHQPCCPCIGADEICLVLMAGAAQRGQQARVEAMARWLVHERAVAEIGRHAAAMADVLARGGLALPYRAAAIAVPESTREDTPEQVTLH